MTILHKTLLSCFLLASMNEQLHASWYPGKYILALLTQAGQNTPHRTPDSVDIPCENHKEYRADCSACNALTQKAAAQKESELRADQKNIDIACNAHKKYDPTCDKCNELTRKAAAQKESELRADKKNQDLPCNNHTQYRADCDECNKLTAQTAGQQTNNSRADNKNNTIPCGNPHKQYDPTCDRCNGFTRKANQTANPFPPFKQYR